MLRGTPVVVGDVGHDPSFQYAAAAAREGLASVLAVPLAVRKRVLGVLRVYTAEPHQFAAEERAFLTAVANLGAQAMERTRLYEAFQAIAQQLNSSLELKDVLTTLLLESVRELNVKAGSIRLLGPQRATLHLAAAYGLSASYIQKGTVEVAHSPIDQQVLHDQQPIAITEVSQAAGLQYPEEAQREGIRSLLVLAALRARHRRSACCGCTRGNCAASVPRRSPSRQPWRTWARWRSRTRSCTRR